MCENRIGRGSHKGPGTEQLRKATVVRVVKQSGWKLKRVVVAKICVRCVSTADYWQEKQKTYRPKTSFWNERITNWEWQSLAGFESPSRVFSSFDCWKNCLLHCFHAAPIGRNIPHIFLHLYGRLWRSMFFFWLRSRKSISVEVGVHVSWGQEAESVWCPIVGEICWSGSFRSRWRLTCATLEKKQWSFQQHPFYPLLKAGTPTPQWIQRLSDRKSFAEHAVCFFLCLFVCD